DSLIKKINQCVENIKVRKSSIELAETNYAMTLKAYNYGTRDLLTLQAAQDNLLESKVNLISEANTLVACLCDLINISDIGFENITGEVNE
ncbi:MAG: TolC family protein, partial [Treponema sp.]|nr:TolC family protein [Treponema sp.]